ncbi:hypothetical protein [Phytomonospora endophytica]|uniref:Uncharacterized protein n=1 Tax=Phytomonospora endophytica TaxID=714109 RepID=A0A841FYD1_9ACTN|nr:hypothetical protein [Phytomonospora endophytica]MBB6038522.1 hypothetical protein [Phytomonospora endophytica]GIG69339.1 hypothetical protein Pen01_56340 [Phytomonospora endophytica]
MTKGMSERELLALPVVVDLDTAAQALRIERTKAYRLAAAGEFPVRVFQAGGRDAAYRVATADLITLIGTRPPRHHQRRTRGGIAKHCTCRDPDTNQKLGPTCPKLHDALGRWSSRHGTWKYQCKLPPHHDGRRRNPLRRYGFATKAAATAELTTVRRCLALAGENPHLRSLTADLITAALRRTRQIPTPETLRPAGTRCDYQAHIHLHITPHPHPSSEPEPFDTPPAWASIEHRSDRAPRGGTMGPDETRKYARSFLRKHRAYLLSLRSGGFKSTAAMDRAETRAHTITDRNAKISALVEVALRAARIAPDDAERIVRTLPDADTAATELAYAHLAAAFAVPYPDRCEKIAALITDELWAAHAKRRIATALAAADLPRAERLVMSTTDRAAQSVTQRAHALLWVAEEGAKQSPKAAQRLIALARKLAVACRSEFLVALADAIREDVVDGATPAQPR